MNEKEIIFSNHKEKYVKSCIFLRKLARIFMFFFHLLIVRPGMFVAGCIANFFKNIYLNLYPIRFKLLKQIKIILVLYEVILVVVFLYYYFNNNFINIWCIFGAPTGIIVYLLMRLLVWTYQFFIGKYQNCESDRMYTYEYVTKYMDKLLKVYGATGKGKDTFQSGCMAMLRVSFVEKCESDMNNIIDICYPINFELLDLDIENNYKLFLSFSKETIEENFFMLARERKMYIKEYYLKSKEIKPEEFYEDYMNFKQNPLYSISRYTVGTGVNRRHFLQLIMEEYIQWWIRLNVEKNFIIANQPYLEDPESELMAKEFSFNMLRTRVTTKDFTNPSTKKKEHVEENIFFPWKDRLILSETECGTWWNNRDTTVQSEMMASGIRDFKAYQRHFMKDFYWFQVDQAPDRTNKLFRELEHSYAGIMSRVFIPGGEKRNRILKFKLRRCEHKLAKMEMKTNKALNRIARNQQRIEDLSNLFVASSKEKYRVELQRLKRKLKPKATSSKYYEVKAKISNLKKTIEENIKDGFIRQTVLVSKTSEASSKISETSIRDVVQKFESGESMPPYFMTTFTFKASECERYDTRYMRNLAEERSNSSIIEFAEVPTWNENFKMTKKDIEWMSYLAVKDQFGITEKEYDSMRYHDKYKEHIKEV